MGDLGLGGINLGIEVELDLVVAFEGVGVAAEGEIGGLEVDFDVGGLNIWYRDCNVEKVLLWIRLVRALCPEDCRSVVLALVGRWR